MSFFEFNDPILSTKRKGTIEDPFVQIAQSILVQNNKVLLAEIPDSFHRVIVEGGGIQWVETNEDLPAINEFSVDYALGIVTFHSSRNNLELTFSYYGTGADYFPASRIWTDTDGTTVTETLAEVVASGKETIANLGGLGNILEIAQQLETDLNLDIVDATNIRDSLSSNITEATTLDTALASTVASANTTITEIAGANTQAQTTKTELDSANQSAVTTKQGLEIDITTSDALRDDLSLLVQDGNTLSSALETNITTAQSVTTSLNGAVVDGQNKIQEMDSKLAEADSVIANTNNARLQVLDTDTRLKVWGEYDNSKQYVPLNKVYYNGSSYVCTSPCNGILPTDEEKWQLIAMRGLDGQGSVDSVNGLTGAVILTADDIGALAKSVYDTNNDGVVDNAERVNGFSVLSNVPANLQSTLDTKVDKVEGMGLSSNDFSNADKTKLDNLSTVAVSGNYNDLLNKPALGTASSRNIGTAAAEIPVLDVNGKLNQLILPEITKVDVGLGNVDNLLQASKTEFNGHVSDLNVHVSSEEKNTWNSKADIIHDHTINDVADLQTTLSAKANQTDLENLAGAGRTTETVKANADAIAIINTQHIQHLADYIRQPGYGTTAGTGTAYTLALSPALSAYSAGVCAAIKIHTANTGAATLNINGLGAKSILKADGSQLEAGDLAANSIYTFRYNGTSFILQGEKGGFARIDLWNYKGISVIKVSSPSNLATARRYLTGLSLGMYAIFAGGSNSGTASATVDAYNTTLIRTSPTVLSLARESLTGTTIGGYALFGGGYNGNYLNVVDAYDAVLTRTIPTGLSIARGYLAATSIGNYALFGGGFTGSVPSNAVDAYNASLVRTLPTALSIARVGLAASSNQVYALFGGGDNGSGAVATVDAYDQTLTRTSPTALSFARYGLRATSVGDYVLFAGGTNLGAQNLVDAYNSSLVRTTAPSLRAPSGSGTATKIGNIAVFSGDYSTVLTAYDASLADVTISDLTNSHPYGASAGIGEYILIAGGSMFPEIASVDAYKVISPSTINFPVTAGSKYDFGGGEQTVTSSGYISSVPPVTGYIKYKKGTIS